MYTESIDYPVKFFGFITYYTTICGFIKWWPFGQQIRKEAQKPPLVFIC